MIHYIAHIYMSMFALTASNGFENELIYINVERLIDRIYQAA